MSSGKKSVGHPIDVATGVMFSTHEDCSLPGKVALTWERRYSTSLLHRAASPLGIGWTARYFATLTRAAGEYRFVTLEGDVETFADPEGVVERGGVVRHLATSIELTKANGRYVLTHWNNAADLVERYVFLEGRAGEVIPLASIEDLGGQGLDLHRDAAGRLVEVRQRLEKRVLTLEYAENQRITAVSLLSPDGKRQSLCTYEYDREARLVAAIDSRGLADRYEYDAAGRITREVVKDGGVFTFRYDEEGRCVKTWGVDGYDQKTLRYREHIGWTEVTNSHGQTTRYEWNASGQVVQEIDPLGGIQRTEFDEHGRIVAMIDAMEGETRLAYDERGNRSAITEPTGAKYQFEFNDFHQGTKLVDPNGGVWQREYDAARRLSATIDPLGARCAYAYDSHGNLARVESPVGARVYVFTNQGVLQKATNWTGDANTYRFDAFGNVTELTDALRRTLRMRYDAVGNLVDLERADGSHAKLAYDAGGNLTSYTDERGNTTRFRYGPCSRLLARVAADGTTSRYEWGSEPGELTRVINENDEAFQYEFDAVGRVVRTVGFDGQATAYEFDKAGRVRAFVNSEHERVAFDRDAGGGLLAMRLPDEEVVSFERDAIGNLIGAKRAGSELVFQRDACGRVSVETQNDVAVQFGYDLVGNRARTSSSLGFQIEQRYDANGALQRLDVAGGSITFERNALGQEIRRAMSSGLEFQQEFDARTGHLTRQTVRSGRVAAATRGGASGNLNFERLYEYAPGGVPLVIQDSRFGKLEYRVDAVDRLLEAKWSDGLSERFIYDQASNLVATESSSASAGLFGKVSGSDERDATLQYERGGRLVRRGDVEYSYDRQGRLIRKVESPPGGVPREWHFAWNALDQLREVRCADGSRWTYQYDALGRRISKQGPSGITRYVWDGNVVLHEQRDGETADAWIFDAQSYTPLAKVQAGELHAVLADQLGTPQAVYDQHGELAWSGRYRAWGEVAETPVERISCAPRFQGQWFDEETGLHYNMYRYYDPRTARYLCTDPIGLAGGVNLYSYVPNPTRWIDPLGLAGDIPLGGGWTGRVDRFNTSFGTDHEMHVYAPNGKEAGIHGSEGWFAKHGHPAAVPHDMPPHVQNTVRNIAIVEARRDGLIPEQGHADLSRGQWKDVVHDAKEKKKAEAEAAKSGSGCSGGGGK
jgi:RHS repeat-associated protein